MFACLASCAPKACRQQSVRNEVRRATTLILRAEAELQEAGYVIANGYLRLDREEWIRVVEKRNAVSWCHSGVSSAG